MTMREEVYKRLLRLSPAAVSPSARLLVSFAYTGDAESEISRFFKQAGKIIVPLTVQEIRDEQIARKLA